MKVKKIKEKRMKVTVPPNSRFPIETTPNMFKSHNIFLAVGKRSSGKSTLICSILRMLKQEKKAHRILVVSGTAISNQALMDSLGVDEDDIFDPDDKMTIPHILGVINDERDIYVKELDKIMRFKELKKVVDGTTIPIDKIDPYMFLEFTNEMGALVKPKLKYGDRPHIVVWFDDCQSSKVFRDQRFQNMIIRHRHVAPIKKKKNAHKDAHSSIGCSVMISIQNLRAQHGGCPRAVRNNATQLAIVGKSQDEQELKDIYSSVAGEIKFDQFMKAYEYATAEKHNSLIIDLDPKDCHPSQFRKNMNEFIIPCECKEKEIK